MAFHLKLDYFYSLFWIDIFDTGYDLDELYQILIDDRKRVYLLDYPFIIVFSWNQMT